MAFQVDKNYNTSHFVAFRAMVEAPNLGIYRRRVVEKSHRFVGRKPRFFGWVFEVWGSLGWFSWGMFVDFFGGWVRKIFGVDFWLIFFWRKKRRLLEWWEISNFSSNIIFFIWRFQAFFVQAIGFWFMYLFFIEILEACVGWFRNLDFPSNVPLATYPYGKSLYRHI